MKKVIVIGAGVAGLASAIRLQHAGYEVEIYEKESLPGGKMHRIKREGYEFDLGPTIVMMPELYREVFELTGRNADDYIPMKKLSPMYSAYFNHGTEKLKVSNDLVQLMELFEGVDEKDAEGFLKYISDLYQRFNIAKHHFLQRPFRESKDFYNLSTLTQGLKLRTLGNAENSMAKYIKDKRLRDIISFQTLYIGISPAKSPSLYTIIPMIEFLYGVWFIEGGMHRMATAMADLFIELGGRIHYNAPVNEILIENSRAIGIRTNVGMIYADYIMCNADFPYAQKNLVKDVKAKGKYTDHYIDKMDYSCSCFVLYLGMDKQYKEIDDIHNFIFSEDLDDNIEQIFEGRLLTDPSIYMYIASKEEPTMAPAGKDGLYILMPISELSTAQYEWNEETVAYYRDKALSKVETLPGMHNIRNEIVTETFISPKEFRKQFNAYNGATFGLQPTLLQSNHLRPQSKATHCENLYFTGSSTHPGAGVPIVLLSSKIAAEELMLDDAL
ncbi:phytoene desaturase [Macrococcus hajekii]|uniref:4,4'-diapophytoene desaturase (4,4'-diaponeurosporene-forming) n=1 Tax=Macrococcus hajekii TaxID=198482 RepID=A0A4R6BJX2_9STAP|nr:phytoene desaturase family protein [Macrococcus hajekii]TDM01930.1 phytoene desaturase [Macrococcus hajekii]GGB08646.1 dehydrosqualene desaturase [Macrococcus hajekii]